MTWWVWLAFALLWVLIELWTYTFVFLSLAIGFVLGSLFSVLGWSWDWQLVAVGVATLGSLGLFWRLGLVNHHHQGVKADLLDIGEQVFIAQWNADGTATCQYRGSSWKVALSDATLPRVPQSYYQIDGIKGIVLLVSPITEKET